MKTSNNKKKIKITFVIVGLVTAIVLVSAESTKADFTFGPPENLGPTLNTSSHDLTPRISADGLSLYFASMRAGGSGGFDLWVTTRSMTSDPWGTPVNLGPTVNSSADDYSLSISADSLALYFVSNRPGGSGGYDIWVTTRPTTSDPWATPVNLGQTVNSSADEYALGISGDGRMLYFTSNRAGGSGGQDVWVTTRPTTNDLWDKPVNLGPTVNSSANEWALGISADGRALYIASERPGGYGSIDLWVTRRATTQDNWGEPVNLGPKVNSSSIDGYPITSADGRMFYFSSNRPGGFGNVDLWQLSITPIVDFNSDGIVDVADIAIMVDNWHMDNLLCDIAPPPWGDGIVDVQDLIFLSEHLFEEVNDPTLVAHWTLDETEGMFAVDSVGDNDAVVLGGVAWQPGSGQVDGALKLDGVSGYAIAGFVLNPADGPLSIFIWIKGGAPGQVVVSQQAMSNWLAMDAEGNLMTELAGPGRNNSPLRSQTVITDGTWHRIGFVWDSSHRTLCVDGVVVAEDTQPTIEGSQMGLYIGVDKNYTPGTFFSGLIDDVCIYNRVVSP